MGDYITYHTVEVLKDTILSNGKTYYYLSGFGDHLLPLEPSLIRLDTLSARLFHSCSSLEYYYEYCQDNEYCVFNLGFPDSSFSYLNCGDEASCYAEYDVGFGRVGMLSDSAQFKNIWFFPGGVGENYKFSENYGISNWSMGEGGAGANAYLIFAQINGQQYGSCVTNVPKTSNNLTFSLEQNYPNPFNSSTTISYTIAKAGTVKLHVYSSTGQLIRTIVNDVHSAGKYSANFFAQNISSGLYFYQLEIESDKSRIKKFIYIK